MIENSEKILQKIGNRTPFSVPENYFEQFSDNIFPFIAEQNRQPARILKLRQWFAAAAAIALLFSVGFMSYNSYKERQISENQDNYETYLMSQIDDDNLMEYYFTSYYE